MQITYDEKTIDFFNFKNLPPQIVLALSGGLESTAIMYLICKHFPEIEIIPFTIPVTGSTRNLQSVYNVNDWLTKEFPSVVIRNIKTIFITDYKDRDYISEERIEQLRQRNFQYRDLSSDDVSESVQKESTYRQMLDAYPAAICVNGMSANPPTDVMTEYGFYDKSERRRDVSNFKKINSGIKEYPPRIYTPFLRVDKKFVADIYRKNDLMDTLFPLTVSCLWANILYPKECGDCYWCYEKKWAFGESILNV